MYKGNTPMVDEIRQSVRDLLAQFPHHKLDAMKQLFWGELNYRRANDPLSTRTWPDSARDALAEPPTLFATAGQSDGFHIVYNRLASDRLLIGPQRPVISQLVQQHPYGLYVVSNRAQSHWHFVNVRYEKKSPSPSQGEGLGEGVSRRVFRRIAVGPRERLRTATERVSMLDIADMEDTQPELFGLSPLAIQQKHDDAFDVEKVTKDFFRTYHAIFEQAEEQITGLGGEARRLFTQRLFNRLLFIIFLERKGWLQYRGEQDYLQALWQAHAQEVQTGDTDNSFYQNRLKLLFFTGLNNRDEVDVTAGVQPVIGNVPYLNGGLFEQDQADQNPAVTVPDAALTPALNRLLYHYNYTVTESTPLDIEVAVDPEMLGKIFEELVTGRHESGSYYTPKPIVAFMGQEALKGYLATACPVENDDALAAFVQQRNAAGLRDPERVLEALKTVKICDPACGSGAYLLGMLHELLELRAALFAARQLDDLTLYQRKLEIIQNNLYGVDIDPFAVNIARLRLWLSLVVDYHGDQPEPLPNLDFKIEVGDSLAAPDPSGQQLDMFRQQQINDFFQLKSDYLMSHGERKRLLREQIEQLRAEIKTYTRGDTRLPENAFDWAVEFAEVFSGVGGGFDIVLANPPYVRQELIKALKPMLKNRYPEVYRGTADLYVYFYARALQLLKPKGMLAFISSNKWLRAKYGEKLRAHFADSANVRSITDFGELPVFETAATFPMVFVAERGKQSDAISFTQVETLNPPYPEVRSIIKKDGYQLPKTAIKGDKWTLASPKLANLLQKLEKNCMPLIDYIDGQVFRGVLTGFNKAFVINESTKQKLIKTDPRNSDIIKPLVAGNDVRRWRINHRGSWLIFTRRGIDINQYPTVKMHLEQWKQELTPKTSVKQKIGRKPGPYEWYEIQDNIAYFAEFDKPKIVYPDIAKEPRFAFDQKGFFFNNTVYFVPTNNLFLLGILNSSVLWKYASERLTVLGDARKGGRLRFFRQFVQKLPIPDASPSQRAAIEALVQKCLDARGQGPQVAQWEAEINRLVYELYHLTPAEIRLVEEAVGASS